MGSKSLFNKNYQQQPRLPSGANQRRRTRETIDPLTEQAIKNTLLSVSGTGESHLPLNQADFILTVNSFDTSKVPHKNNSDGAAAANNSDLRKNELQQLQLDPNAHGAIKRVTDKMKVIRDKIVTNCGNDVKFVTEDSTTANETDATNHIIYPFGKQELRPHSSSKTTSKEVSSTGFFGNASTKTVSETISSMDGWTCTWGMKIRIVSSGDDAAFTMNVAKILDTLYACETITVFSLHYSLDQASKDKLCEKVRADAIEDATNKAKKLVASLNKTNNNNSSSSSTSTLSLGRLKTFVETSEGVSRGSPNEQGRILQYRRNKQGGFFGSGSDNDDDDDDHTSVSVSKKCFRNKKNAFDEDVEKYSLTLSCDFELLQPNASDDNNNVSSTIGHFDVFGSTDNNNKQSSTTTTTHLRSSISVYPKDDKDESAMTATQCAQQMADRQKALSDTLAPLILTEDSSCELIFSKIPRFTAYTKKSFSATAELCIIVKQQDPDHHHHQSTSTTNLRWALLYEQLYNFGYTNINVEHTKTKQNNNDNGGADDKEEKPEDSSSSVLTEVACTEAWAMAKRYADQLNLEVAGVYAVEDFSSASLDDSSSSTTTIRQDLPGARPGPGAIAFTAAGGQIQQQQQQQGNSILSSISSSSSANGAQYYHNNPVGAESLSGRGFYRVSFKFVAKK